MFARHRRLILVALAVSIGAIGVACLNPQPLPPEPEAPPAGGGDRIPADASFSDAAAAPPQNMSDGAGGQATDANDGKNDGGIDAAPPDAGDASTDAPSDALEDR
jgi:hypothetical protein